MPEPHHPDAPHRRCAAALMAALHKHRSQSREDGTPYVAHPIRVAESLRTIGGVTDTDVIVAALLHDLIEDTDTEHDDVRGRFGKRVADLVSALSGDMRLPKPERRVDVIERARHADGAVKAVRLADRLDNLDDMAGFSAARRAEHLDGSRRILEACRGANPALEAALQAAIDRLAAG